LNHHSNLVHEHEQNSALFESWIQLNTRNLLQSQIKYFGHPTSDFNGLQPADPETIVISLNKNVCVKKLS
jgi:hypothetical protein